MNDKVKENLLTYSGRLRCGCRIIIRDGVVLIEEVEVATVPEEISNYGLFVWLWDKVGNPHFIQCNKAYPLITPITIPITVYGEILEDLISHGWYQTPLQYLVNLREEFTQQAKKARADDDTKRFIDLDDNRINEISKIKHDTEMLIDENGEIVPRQLVLRLIEQWFREHLADIILEPTWHFAGNKMGFNPLETTLKCSVDYCSDLPATGDHLCQMHKELRDEKEEEMEIED